MSILEKLNKNLDKKNKESIPGETDSSNPPMGVDQAGREAFHYLVSSPEHEEETHEEIENTLGTVHVSRPSIQHVFFLLRPFLKPLLSAFDKQQAQLDELVKILTLEHLFIDRPFAISNNVSYDVNYLGHKYLYLMTTSNGFPFLLANGNALYSLGPNQWHSITFPAGTHITAQGISDSNPVGIIVRACDVPMTLGVETVGNLTLTPAGTPSDSFPNPSSISEVLSFSMAWNGSGWQRVLNSSYSGDNNSASDVGLITKNDNYIFNGTGWDKQRTPIIFKPIKAQAITAGTPVSVWTPAGGKKFRMMGYTLASTVAASILFEDATGSANEFWRTPLVPAATTVDSPPGMGNGYLSTTANNALFLDVTVTGVVSGTIYGTEE